MRILSASATLLDVDIHDRPEEITLTSFGCRLFRLIVLLRKNFFGLDPFDDLQFSARVFSRDLS